MTVYTVRPPAMEPVSLLDAKAYLRIGHGEMDELISQHIKAARSLCERETGLVLINQQVYIFLDQWPGSGSIPWWNGLKEGTSSALSSSVDAIPLPVGPAVSLDEMALLDENNQATLVSPVPAYATAGLLPMLVRRNGMMWPRPLRKKSGIRLLLTAGFGNNAADIPFALREGMLQLITHRLDDPAKADIPKAVRRLWASYRRISI